MVILVCKLCGKNFSSNDVPIHSVKLYAVGVLCPRCDGVTFIFFARQGKMLTTTTEEEKDRKLKKQLLSDRIENDGREFMKSKYGY